MAERLIDARQIRYCWMYDADGKEHDGVTLQSIIDRLPTIDAVRVIRCKECKHKVRTRDGKYNPDDIVCDYHMSDGFTENDFCSFGEREIADANEV